MTEQKRKKVVVVLGVSRSGTSAIARGLKALGIDLGSKLIPADSRNPRGFWEDGDVLYKINRGISTALDRPWLGVDLFEEKELEETQLLNTYKEHAAHLLQERFATTDYWGFKDPRTITLLPFWQSVFKESFLDDHYIIVMRNPLSAAHSVKKFINCDLEVGLMLWLVKLFAAVEGTHGRKRSVVNYELMLYHPRQQLERMHTALALPFALEPHQVDSYIHDFLDDRLRHYTFSEEEFKASPLVKVAPLCVPLYDLLLKLAKDEMVFDSPSFQTAWQALKAEFSTIYPVYQFIDTLLKRQKQYEREMRAIYKSWPWKMVYPLRLVENGLRHFRKKIRKKKQRLIKAYGS